MRGTSPDEGPLHGYSAEPAWADVANQYLPRFTWWLAGTDGSIEAQFGTGFGRLTYQFRYAGNELRGRVRARSDDGAELSPSAAVIGRPIQCPVG